MDDNMKKSNFKGLLKNEELYQYHLETSVYPREPEALKELRAATATHPRAVHATTPDAGQFIALLLNLIHARKTIEIGVFTGYSLLLTALAIPDDGMNENVGTFDFAFVDADKTNNLNYHEKLLKLIKPGGIIVYDNTLWGGRVVMSDEFEPENKREIIKNVIEFNKFLAADTRVEINQVPLGDGITICRPI